MWHTVTSTNQEISVTSLVEHLWYSSGIIHMKNQPICIILTRFAKRGLPHTSNSLNLEDHNYNLAIKHSMELKLFPAIKPCWHLLHTKFQVNNLYQFKLWIIKVAKLDECGRPLLANLVTIIPLFVMIILDNFANSFGGGLMYPLKALLSFDNR